jgi:hypothetical protein
MNIGNGWVGRLLGKEEKNIVWEGKEEKNRRGEYSIIYNITPNVNTRTKPRTPAQTRTPGQNINRILIKPTHLNHPLR